MSATTSFTVITENDESQWEDTTGVSYHFPKRYLKYLKVGTNVVYYKGRIKNVAFRERRLSDEPHYFGFAQIGGIYADAKSPKGDHFAEVLNYRLFDEPVLAKQDGDFIEIIPESRVSNYWRDGVRPITQDVYGVIESLAKTSTTHNRKISSVSDHLQGVPESLTSGIEGNPSLRFVSTYERDPKLRDAAIRIHGTTCVACGFNFAETYGQHGAGYIQVHHLEPLGDAPGERCVNAEADLIVLCANCHVMVHRYRKKTLALKQLKTLIEENRT
ncbi:HNH endonuclease [filamentous cyanobacterium LEGE 11480]|uniref:HNH endonuclease n=1 Tax=Romeriopsis navalis LEGE 11480 TaxID=2777977 RepID=A0A928VNL7_9CYAN|nr:hypothetical protein [Romeriopsis navalis]MBE9029184.1 HNH endonuclease [Romeriopsis navalis LEGE 11480]